MSILHLLLFGVRHEGKSLLLTEPNESRSGGCAMKSLAPNGTAVASGVAAAGKGACTCCAMKLSPPRQQGERQGQEKQAYRSRKRFVKETRCHETNEELQKQGKR